VKKRRAIFLLYLVVIIVMTGMFSMACGPTDDGRLYTISSAYDIGLITDDDVHTIIENLNSGNSQLIQSQYIENSLGENTVAAIKKYGAQHCADFIDDDIELVEHDIFIHGYYGKYNNSFAITVSFGKINVLDVMRKIKIGTNIFEISGPDIFIWTND